MSASSGILFLVLSSIGAVFAQANPVGQTAEKVSPLEVRIPRFQLRDAIFRDGVSELSLKNIAGLHLGFEEVIRGRSQDDPRKLAPHFSLMLENKSVRDILDGLCGADPRYVWSQDGESINLYPRAEVGNSSYLLNLRIESIAVSRIKNPDQALEPLSKLFPEEQVGYFGPGLGDNHYDQPWTVTFEDLTVRQFVNRMAEHTGIQTSWVWEGGKGERMFTFLKGGFRTSRPTEAK